MSGIRIACPKCGKHLVLKDRGLLGRKGKCPACSHRFVLREPPDDEVELQLVEAEPAEGVAPQWIPDESLAADVALPETEPNFPAMDGAGRPAVPNIVVDAAGGVDRLREIKRRGRRRAMTAVVGGVVFVVGVAAAYLLIAPSLQETTTKQLAPQQRSVEQGTAGNNTPPQTVDADWVAQLSPTDGEPIQLFMVPSGARLIVNFHPARLWGDERQMVELRASLTEDFVNWIAAQLKTLCHREPAQIEEVLIAWILGARGTEPQVATVVHLAEEERLSDLIEEFGGEPLDEFAQPKVYLRDETAVLIRDPRTFAICPRSMASDLADTVVRPNLDTSDGLLEVLELTDHDRLLTVAFEPADLKRHLGMLVGEAVRPLLAMATEWLAQYAETVGWSLHAGEELHSEIVVRGPSTSSAFAIETDVKTGLETIPRTLVAAVRKMNPQRLGFRKIIGRFPAMLEVFRLATVSSLEGRTVRFITVLPPKAAPNLALGAVLTWDEATRTDFSAQPTTMAAAQATAPKTVAQRLQLPVEAEFTRTPLQEAIEFIAGEIDVTIDIDGDALKDAGYTKNMAQTFNIGKVTAERVLGEIVKQYQEPGKLMVISVDETRNTITVLTKKFADQKGLPVYPLGNVER